MKSPEVGIAHREKASQELLVKTPLGKINSHLHFSLFLGNERTMYFYNCSSLNSLKTENRRAGWSLHTAEGSHFFPCQKVQEQGLGTWLSQTWLGQWDEGCSFFLDSLLLLSLLSFLPLFFPFLFLSLSLFLLPSFPSVLSSFLYSFQVLLKYHLSCRYHTSAKDKENNERVQAWGVYNLAFPWIL